jgi:hypothetical protein
VSELPPPQKVIELTGDVGHVQGIAVEGNRAWISWVDQKSKSGTLAEFDLATGKMVKSAVLQKGEQYHPGGISLDGDFVLVPVAEYKANSSAVIQRRNKNTLALDSEFAVADHIGCVAVDAERIYGGNWDTRQIYTWDRHGRAVSKLDNSAGNRTQDMQFIGGQLIAGGLRGSGGAVDWLDPGDLHLIRRIRAGKSDRGVVLTHEGMAMSGGKLYLLPEDGPSRVFVYELPNGIARQ